MFIYMFRYNTKGVYQYMFIYMFRYNTKGVYQEKYGFSHFSGLADFFDFS